MSGRPRLRFLPEGREGGGILPSIIAVMAYLSVIAIAVGFGAHNMAAGWFADLNGTATVQIVALEPEARERQAAAALELLNATPGIRQARLLSDDENAALLEQWLGSGNVTADLPVPALISVTLAPNAKLDLAALQSRISKVAPDARLDDQQTWIRDMSNLARSVQLATAAAVLMISGATIAIVVFATRARLESHREDVEIVHMMGAEDTLIAGEMRYHFLVYGLKGGMAGYILGVATLLAIQYFGRQIGEGLVPQIVLSVPQIGFLLAVPLAATFIAAFTAGIATRNSLEKMM